MSPQIVAATYGTVNEFSRALDELGWTADFRQLNPGAETINVEAAHSETAFIQRVDFSNAVHQRVLPPSEYMTFGIPTHAQIAGRMGRRLLESETITRFSESSGFDAVSMPGFSAYTVSLEKSRLSRLAQDLGVVDPYATSTTPSVQKLPDRMCLAHLRGLLRVYLDVSKADISMQARKNMVVQFEWELSTLLMRTWFESDSIPYVRRSNRSRALKRALDYLQSYPGKVITVEQLCHESACSASTLERAFREHFGVTPKRYLLAMRLSAVRRTLLRSVEHTSVSEVAAQWGFWHMSKFAADYKRMFGELPSATRYAS